MHRRTLCSRAGFIALAVMIGLSGRSAVEAQGGLSGGEWPEYSGDPGGMKYSPLDQINANNVRDLRVAWRWASADRDIQRSDPTLRATRHEDTPLMINGVLYTVTPLGMVAALDPGTGEQRWLYDPEVYGSGKPGNSGFIHRGLAYWTDGTNERILLGTNNAYLISIDARTGRPDRAFGQGGRVDLTEGIPRGAVRAQVFAGRRPAVAGDVIVVGNAILDPVRTRAMPPGYVQAYDVRTGAKRWTFHTVPQEYEFGYDTWLDGSAEYTGNTNVWAGISYDPDLDYVYLPVSGATSNRYGGHRPGDNLFAESLVCVEAKTGRRVWHFQLIHHGLWDYDVPAQPILGEITVEGRRIKAVMQLSKQGFTYVFDRVTGEPVWPIEEHPVPQSRVPYERTSPTQPFPTKPPAFTLQGAVEENLLDFTPALRARARDQLRQIEHGPLYTPPSEAGTPFLPGTFGGANWGGGAFDPETGILYVPSLMMPSIARATGALFETLRGEATEGARSGASEGRGARGADVRDMLTIEGLSIFKPPYTSVTAIDMNAGELLWSSPLGNGPRRHPLLRELGLPPLGDEIHRTGALLTKTLLFVNAQRLNWSGTYVPPVWAEWGDPDMDRKLVYVFDKQSGDLLHTVELDGRSAALPMTYLHEGRQYIVVATGGSEFSEIVALALPEAPGPR